MRTFVALILALGSPVAAQATARAAAGLSVDTAACAALRPAALDERLALELESDGRRASRADTSVRIDCSTSLVRIWVRGAATPREIPAPDANDPEPERTVAIAVVEALATDQAGPRSAPSRPDRTFRPGLALALAGTVPTTPGFGVAARGWLPTGEHVAFQLGVHLGWTHAKQASGAAIDATIPELELAVAYRPPLPSSLPGSEGRVFVAPALALTSGTPAVDGGRDWTVTTGVGWGLYGHVGRMLLGTSWDFGLTWPAPVEALDPNDRSWTRRVMMRMSLYAGFEAGGG